MNVVHQVFGNCPEAGKEFFKWIIPRGESLVLGIGALEIGLEKHLNRLSMIRKSV